MAEPLKKLKWTRKRAPKARTGCITWYVSISRHLDCSRLISLANARIRHLKCDEGKPTCQRCAKDKLVCDGYVAAIGRRPKHKVIVKPDCNLPLTSRLLLPTPLSLQPAASPGELDLCHHVRVCTVSELAKSLAPTDFWLKYALPLSHVYQPIETAVCALGSAHKYFKLQDQMDLVGRQSCEATSLGQYNLAIRAAHQYMGSPERKFEVILTCCLIFICIENLHGRHADALRHLESAFSLLNTPYQWDAAHSSTPDKRQDLTTFLRNIGPLLCGLASDTLFYMDDEISPKLVSGLVSWVEAQDPVDLGDTVAPFPSCQAAAFSLVRIQSMCDAELCSEECNEPNGDDSASCCDTEDCLIQTLFDNWNARFKAFRARFDYSKATRSEIYRLKTLELEQITWEVTLNQDSIEDDLETTDCVEILRRAESLIRYAGSGPGRIFTFDANLIPPVSLVIISCQDSDIQWKGVSLLRSIRRREGIWDSEEIADLYARIITVKEEKLVAWDDLPRDVPSLAEMANSLQLSPLSRARGN
ncbi:hypothetical protein B0T10DRAFT_501989, partial [Thelonectria olida]